MHGSSFQTRNTDILTHANASLKKRPFTAPFTYSATSLTLPLQTLISSYLASNPHLTNHPTLHRPSWHPFSSPLWQFVDWQSPLVIVSAQPFSRFWPRALFYRMHFDPVGFRPIMHDRWGWWGWNGIEIRVLVWCEYIILRDCVNLIICDCNVRLCRSVLSSSYLAGFAVGLCLELCLTLGSISIALIPSAHVLLLICYCVYTCCTLQ